MSVSIHDNMRSMQNKIKTLNKNNIKNMSILTHIDKQNYIKHNKKMEKKK